MDATWEDAAAAQARLDGQLDLSSRAVLSPGIYKFKGDSHKRIPGRFSTGEIKVGNPFEMKFFRGVAIYGSGHLEVRVFVDAVPTVIHRPLSDPDFGKSLTYGSVELVETPDPQRVLWLPRGTKGRTISLEGAGDFKHVRGIVIYWDPLTGEEDG